MICALNLPDGTIAYASGSSWAVVRDYARGRWGLTNDDVQARHEAPEGVDVLDVAGPMSHDDRRADEARGVRLDARRAAFREVSAQWMLHDANADAFFVWLNGEIEP